MVFRKGIILLVFFALISCEQFEYSRSEFALGTVCTIALYEQGRSGIYNSIFKRIFEIEQLMSVNIPDSDISRINAAAGINQVQVDNDTFYVIQRALYFAEKSGGAFDPTVGPLVSLWNIGADVKRIPSEDEINNVLPLVNFRYVELDLQTNSVYLTKIGMALDLGAIAKGYAADEAAKILRQTKIKSAKIDLGGDVYMYGKKRDKSPWRIGLQNPVGDRGSIIGVLRTGECTIVTSGVYERYFEIDENRYHHIFSPFNGYPVNNGLLSVTIVSDNSMDSDALSTSVFVLGYEKGLALVKTIPGAEAVFIFDDKSLKITSGLDFILTDNSYQTAATKE